MRRIPAVVTALSALALTTCVSAVPAELSAARRGPVALPAGDGAHLVFRRDRVERRRGAEVEWSIEHADAGDPLVSAIDLDSAWAAVGYARRLAFVQLAAQRVSWTDSPASDPRGLALRGETAALWSGTRAVAVRVPSGAVLWEDDLAPLLESVGVNRLEHLVPRGDDRALVLGSRTGSSFTDGKVVVLALDRSRGDWRIENESTLRGLTWVHRAASEGAALYVAGLREETQRSPGGPGRLLQALVVAQVDLDTLSAREILWSQRQARSTVVHELAVGTNALALLLDGKTVEVYRIVENGRATAPVFDQHFASAESLAWISPAELLVVADGEPRSVRY